MTFGVEAFQKSSVAKFGPSEDSFYIICSRIAVAMGQKGGEKWIAAVGLQPMYRKSDSLLEVDLILDSSVGRARVDRWQRAWGRCASLRASGPLRRHPCRAQPGQRLGLFVPFNCAQAQLKLRHSAYPAPFLTAHSGASN